MFSRAKKSDGQYTPYSCAIVSRRINDQRIVSHSPLMLREWRANTDFSVLFNLTKVMLYVTKYATKCETKSVLFNSAAQTIFSDGDNENMSTKTGLRRLMLKVLGERDVAVPEAIHMLMGWPLHASNIKVATVNLMSSRALQKNANREATIKDSLVDLYAKRNIEQAEINFNDFAMKFECVGGELVERRTNKDKLALRFFQRYSSNPNSDNYDLYCKFSLLRYKPWHTRHAQALDTDINGITYEDNEEGWIESWRKFLLTEVAKNCIPEWYHRTIDVHRRIEDNDVRAEIEEMDQEEYIEKNDDDYTQEDWMSNMNPASRERGIGPDSNALIDNIEYWQSDRIHFDQQEIMGLPMWLKTEKSKNIETEEEYPHVDLSLLNSTQRLAYDIIQKHFTNTPSEQLLLRLEGQGGELTKTSKFYINFININ